MMIGATALTIKTGPVALVPFTTGVLAAFVAYARWRVAPHREGWQVTVPRFVA